MIRLAKVAFITLVCCTVVCATPQAASSQTYSVFNCHFPDGSIAPTDAWQVINPASGAAYDLSCTDGSGLGVSLSHTRSYPQGYEAGIGLHVPPDLTITEATVKDQRWASGTADWATMAGYWAAWQGAPWQAVNVCDGTCSGASTWHLVAWGLNFEMFGLGVGCSPYRPKPCPSTASAGAVAWGVELKVADSRAPAFSSPVTGSLLDRRSSAAIRQLRYAVVDQGGGVRSATLQIDGKNVQNAVFSNGASPCKVPYGQLVPCPPTVSGVFTVDTSRLGPGRHSGRLLVNDVANPPLVYAFEFFAPGPPTNATACSVDQPVIARLTENPIPYGSRRVRFSVHGLKSPPRHAFVLEEKTAGFTVIGSAKLSHRRYVAKVRMSYPKTVRIALPLTEGTQYACSQPIRVAVKAGLTLSVRPGAVSNGDTIRFRGRLRGGQSAGGRLVEIQVRALGGLKRWTLVQTLRTGSTGRFRMRYTFRRTHQRVRFQFRAVRRQADDFPYAFGASNREVVLVRG